MPTAEAPSFDPIPQIAADLQRTHAQVAATVALFAAGGTVPFIARYRKEATGGLDEVQIRAIEERRAYLQDLEARRQVILASVASQGKLSDSLRQRLLACSHKAALEDLYLPFKPKRHSRAALARALGLEPLAERLLAQPDGPTPQQVASAFVGGDGQAVDVDAALAGARDIVAERCAEAAEVRAWAREHFHSQGQLVAKRTDAVADRRTPFEQYYDFAEPLKTLPSHRFLAIRRGEREGVLQVQLVVDRDAVQVHLRQAFGLRGRSPFGAQLEAALEDGAKRLLLPSVETDVRVSLKQRADAEAVGVFASNLRHLLLAAPLGGQAVLGIDPGLRTGCKCVALDATGKYLSSAVLHLVQSDAAAERARTVLRGLLQNHAPSCIVVGNGTGGREAEAFIRSLLKADGVNLPVVPVSEAGASVYSASEAAREEFPELDLTLRGAISIGRRLQDPLAELVKIDPKAIGVGQYQHDVHQPLLQRRLQEVVTSCVNHVGVQLNTASAALLAQVAGIGPTLAKKIVAHRDRHGAYSSRNGLLAVAGLGPRAFEQAAGFLRVAGGAEPLDGSAVHPERYALVRQMAHDLGVAVQHLVGDTKLAANIDVVRYVDAEVGEPTLRDIVAELQRPGRDPRDHFEPPKFRDDVHTLAHLTPGMALEGIITNVTAFGAFVDIGVHQDGLVHVSQLADRFVKDPSEVARVGDRLQVRVLEVDMDRRRIALTARSDGGPPG